MMSHTVMGVYGKGAAHGGSTWRAAPEPGRDRKGRWGSSCLLCARCCPGQGWVKAGGRRQEHSRGGGAAWWGPSWCVGPRTLHTGRRNGKAASSHPWAVGAVGRQEGPGRGAEPGGAPALCPEGTESPGGWAGGGQHSWGWTGLHQCPWALPMQPGQEQDSASSPQSPPKVVPDTD